MLLHCSTQTQLLNSVFKNKTIEAATGKWPQILNKLGGISETYLTNKHGPCPLCPNGTKRFRFDDLNGTGSWYCNDCGGKDRSGGGGSGFDLLMRYLDLDFKVTIVKLEKYLGIESPKKKERKLAIPPADAKPFFNTYAENYWTYHTADGGIWFHVARFIDEKGNKEVKPYCWDTIESKWVNAAWKSPRPLYNLHFLTKCPNHPVIIVEGEKSADAAQRLFPFAVATTWSGGCKAVKSTDWGPLKNRKILMWPDNDEPGESALKLILSELNQSISVVRAPEGSPSGWDIADADWTPEQATKYINENMVTVIPPGPEVEKPEGLRFLPSDAPFRCLGFDRDNFYYMPNTGGQIIEISAGSHTKNKLISLGDLVFWKRNYQKESGAIDWDSAVDDMIRECRSNGVYDPERIRGRGAWFDDGRVIFHLGDRLVIDNKSQPILKPFKSNYFYENAKPLRGPGNDSLPDAIAKQIYEIAFKFNWEAQASAHLLMGWIVLAPVCGALNWRPHIWLTGGPGTGKSTILKLFMKPLLGGIFQRAEGGTTEAGLRNALESDAIPVVFDEFEQNKKNEREIVQSVLALARIASSEDGGKILKGKAQGGYNAYEIRSMFCVSSINVALIQRADIERFCVLPLKNGNTRPASEWREFERQIKLVSSEQNGRALIARTLPLIPIIRHNARIFAAILGRRFGQRFGDQHGTLLAGAWSLGESGAEIVNETVAETWINSMEWESAKADDEDSDEMKCMSYIMQSIISLDGGAKMSVLELIEMEVAGRNFIPNKYGEAVDDVKSVLGRYGLKVQDDDLAISNTNKNLSGILADTAWGNNGYRQSLRRINGARASRSVLRFPGSGPSRCTLVSLRELGIVTPSNGRYA